MSDNTELLGVKVKPETKKEIEKLIGEAKTAGMIELKGDIFDLFVEQFQRDEMAKKMAYGADLKELSQITRRINEIFVNLSQRNETNEEDLRIEHNKIADNLKLEINELKDKINTFKESLNEKTQQNSELVDKNTAYKERITELEEVQNGYIERIEEQKTIIDEKDEKINNKNELISEKEEAIAAMKEDIAQVNDLRALNDSLNNKISKLEQLITSKDDDLQRQKESLEFECQKRVFAREQVLNKEKSEALEKLQDHLSLEIKRYQDKYEKVLEEKEKLRSANYELKATIDQVQNDNERKDILIADNDKEIEELKKRIATINE